jgi:outer membrane lipoprotein-sorting protein
MNILRRLLMKKFLSLLFVLGVFAVGPAFAEDAAPAAGAPDEAAMKKMMELSSPGEMHKMLATLAGDWTYTSKMWMTPDAPAEESKGISKNEMVYDGRFLKMSVTGSMKMNGQDVPFAGESITGFDNVTQQFKGVWYDSFTTGMMISKGTYDAATKTISETGEGSCVMRGTAITTRSEMKFIDADTYNYTMYMPDDSGKEYKSMEIEYKRVK